MEGKGFMNLITHAYPAYPLPTAKYFAGLVPKEQERVKSILRPKIDAAASLNFTSDVWSTLSAKESFISLTGKIIAKITTLFLELLCLSQ